MTPKSHLQTLYYACILKAYSVKLKYCIFKLPFSNAVNLLSNVPVSCLDVLICPLTHEETAQEAATLDELPSDKTAEKDTALKNNTLVYNGMNMEAIYVLLNFMEKRIDKVRLLEWSPWKVHLKTSVPCTETGHTARVHN